MAIDYGEKRCGVAVTDPLQLIATSLSTQNTEHLESFLIQYCKSESVDKIVFGMPKHKDGNDTHLSNVIRSFSIQIQQKINHLSVDFINESFSSFEAKQKILESGVKKSKRRDKSLVDQLTAVILLQKYLNHI